VNETDTEPGIEGREKGEIDEKSQSIELKTEDLAQQKGISEMTKNSLTRALYPSRFEERKGGLGE